MRDSPSAKSSARAELACEACGALFVVWRYRIKRGDARFCSVTCASTARGPQFTDAERAARFMERVDRSRGDDACWPWMGYRNDNGYGRLTWRGKSTFAHRVAYELATGVAPGDLDVLHRCDNPPCCNAERHLFLGTAKVNGEDAAAKNRTSFGHRHAPSKLTEGQVALLRERRAEGASYNTLAREFGVAYATARDAALGITWRRVG